MPGSGNSDSSRQPLAPDTNVCASPVTPRSAVGICTCPLNVCVGCTAWKLGAAAGQAGRDSRDSSGRGSERRLSGPMRARRQPGTCLHGARSQRRFPLACHVPVADGRRGRGGPSPRAALDRLSREKAVCLGQRLRGVRGGAGRRGREEASGGSLARRQSVERTQEPTDSRRQPALKPNQPSSAPARQPCQTSALSSGQAAGVKQAAKGRKSEGAPARRPQRPCLLAG